MRPVSAVCIAAAVWLGGWAPAANAADTAAPHSVGQTMPAMELYALVYRAGPNWKPGKPMAEQGLAAHGADIKQLFDRGQVFAGGRRGPDGGLLLFHAHDLADAEALMAADPAIRTGIFVGEVQRFKPRFLQTGPLLDKRE